MPDSEGSLESRVESKIFQNLIIEWCRLETFPFFYCTVSTSWTAKAGQAAATTTKCGVVQMLWEETAEDPHNKSCLVASQPHRKFLNILDSDYDGRVD